MTSPDKVFFAERGETKLDLVRYYLAVAEPLMRAAGGRPALMQRFPQGAEGSSFFQKRVPESAPEWLETAIVSTPNGTTSRALVLADMAHVVWAVNLGCLGFHVWPYRADDAEVADELRLDLDPQPGVGFDEVRAAALELRALLDELGLTRLPEDDREPRPPRLRPARAALGLRTQVRSAAVAVARELERRRPELITAAWWKEERGERVFVDFNQNAPHKTVFGAWSVRARPGAQVSAPLHWDELDAIHPDELTIASVPARLAATATRGQAIGERAAVAGAAARAARARPRGRPDGRALAARLPEAAERAAAGRAEPRAQGSRVSGESSLGRRPRHGELDAVLQLRVYGEPALMAAVAERLDALAGARHVSLAEARADGPRS